MSSNSKHVDTRQVRDLSASELDAVAGGAATKPREPFPGPCFPVPPKPIPQIM